MKKFNSFLGGGSYLAAFFSAALSFVAANAPAQAQAPQKPLATVATPTTTAALARGPGRIVFYGQSPASTPYGHVDPIDACPNVVNTVFANGNPGGAVNGQPYRFEFDTECLGNYYDNERPPFIWVIKYLTESGRIYQEKIGDLTKNDYSRMKIYFYDRVPSLGTATNLDATKAGGNQNVSLSPITAAGNTAQPGEPIYGIRLECTGYSCQVTDDVDAIDIRYYSRRPDAIALSSTQPLCRNAAYAISASSVLGATNYLWYTAGLNGATISGVSGNNATLNLGSVPAGTNSITLRVAAQDNAHCGGTISESRDLTLNLEPSPATLQDMQLSNGLCPTTGGAGGTDKTVSVAVPSTYANPSYSWTISGPGAYFVNTGSPTYQGQSSSLAVKTPQAGDATVSVSAKANECGGYSPVYSKTFRIGSLAPVCVQPVVERDRCSADRFGLIFETAPSGLNYYPGAIRNVSNGSTLTVTQNQSGSPSFGVSSNTALTSAFSFDLSN